MNILAFGEILWDVFPDGKHLGGASLNYGAHLARHGHTVYPVSALGADSYGEEALEVLARWNLKKDLVATVADKQTGKCIVTLDAEGMPKYDLLRDVAYDYIPATVAGQSFDVLYFGTLAMRQDYNRASLTALMQNNKFTHIFADINIRPPFQFPETTDFAAKNATILKVSLEELPEVARLLEMEEAEPAVFAKALADRYCNLQYIIITLGGDGAYTLDCKAQAEYACPGVKVAVVSTVGAGDSFSAAFTDRLMAGCNLDDCLAYAARVAAYVVSQQGAVPEYSPADFQ